MAAAEEFLSDRPGAQEAIKDLRTMLAMGTSWPGAWKPPIVAATAVTGHGIDDLVGRLEAHGRWLGESGERDRRRLARAREEVSAMAVATLRERLGALPGGSHLEDLAAGQPPQASGPDRTAADDTVAGPTAVPSNRAPPMPGGPLRPPLFLHIGIPE